MNSQSPITVGMEPPVMAKAHLTFSFGTSAGLRPGLAWKRCEVSSPTLLQSEPVARIGGFVAHLTSTPTGAVGTRPATAARAASGAGGGGWARCGGEAVR